MVKKKYGRTIYRIITAHISNPMREREGPEACELKHTRGTDEGSRVSSFVGCQRNNYWFAWLDKYSVSRLSRRTLRNALRLPYCKVLFGTFTKWILTKLWNSFRLVIRSYIAPCLSTILLPLSLRRKFFASTFLFEVCSTVSF